MRTYKNYIKTRCVVSIVFIIRTLFLLEHVIKGESMEDVQKSKPEHQITIEKVGINKLRYPVAVLKKSNDFQYTVADVELSVELPSNIRGTHMSRFISSLERFKHKVDGEATNKLLYDILKTLDCKKAQIQMMFPFFILKRAPISKESSLFETTCGYKAKIDNDIIDSMMIVKTVGTTLCPCSKAISNAGAHNQKCYVTVHIKSDDFIWFEDVIGLVDECFSAPIYPLLKRKDEKWVTEVAYSSPAFVEDLVRSIYTRLGEIYKDKISYVKIKAESDESIHQHQAFAVIEKVLK